MSTKVYDIVTARIMDQMSKGNIPWVKPWNTSGMYACNYQGRQYQGMNFFLMNLVSYPIPIFLTFKQVMKQGGKVIKGAESLPVFLWNWIEKVDATGKKDKFPIFRYYNVFNIEQTEGIDLPAWYKKKLAHIENNTVDINQTCEAIITNYQNKPEIAHGGAKAMYSPTADRIAMPQRNTFNSTEHYYATLFHECGHSTGHATRLNRKELNEPTYFGSHEYSKEELTAELTAAFLCAEARIDNQAIITNSAAYLQSWMKALKNDPKLFVTAAGKAQKAFAHITNLKEYSEEESDNTVAA